MHIASSTTTLVSVFYPSEAIENSKKKKEFQKLETLNRFFVR